MRKGVVGLFGVAGLAGAGKTTAAMHLSTVTAGRYLYLGQTVLDEVCARGLPATRDSERQVRVELRREKGPAAFAMPHVDVVAQCFEQRIPVFVDAIFKKEEFDLLASCVPSSSARLLAINASFDIRSARLSCRSERPFNADELRKRDETELKQLGTGAVMLAAAHAILNEGRLDEFYERLAEFLSCCG